MDISEVYTPLRERLWEIVILIGALLICAGAGTGFVWRHQRTRFYREKYEAAEAFSAELKQSADTLRVAHERLRRFVDSNIVGVVIANAAGHVIEANDYYLNLIGFTQDELKQGKVDWRAITPPEWLPADEKAIRELRERGSCIPYEKEYMRRDDTRVSIFIANALLPGPEEQIAAFVLDITRTQEG